MFLFFLCSQKQKIYILFIAVYCPSKLLVSEPTITFHVHFLLNDSFLFWVCIYCILKKRNMLPPASLRAPPGAVCPLRVEHLSVYLFQCHNPSLNNKVLMISYSTEAACGLFLKHFKAAGGEFYAFTRVLAPFSNCFRWILKCFLFI